MQCLRLPGPAEIAYPTLLDFPAPRLKGYPRETAIAEQFEALPPASRRPSAASHASLLPVARAQLAAGNFKMKWTAGGPWRE